MGEENPHQRLAGVLAHLDHICSDHLLAEMRSDILAQGRRYRLAYQRLLAEAYADADPPDCTAGAPLVGIIEEWLVSIDGETRFR